PPPSEHRATRLRTQLLCDALEDRMVPTTLTIAAVADSHEGGPDGLFRVTRDGDPTDPLTFLVTPSGAADPTSDYTFAGTTPAAGPVRVGGHDQQPPGERPAQLGPAGDARPAPARGRGLLRGRRRPDRLQRAAGGGRRLLGPDVRVQLRRDGDGGGRGLDRA